MSEQNTGADTVAPSTSELAPAPGAPVDGGVVDTSAQPADPSAAAPEGEGAPAQPAAPDPRSPAGRISHYSRQAQQEREARLRAEGEAEALRRLVQAGQQPQPAAQPEPQQPTGPVRPDHTDRTRYPLGDIDPQFTEDLADYKARVIAAEMFEARDKQAREAAEAQTYTAQVDTAAAAAEAAGFPDGAELLRSAPPAARPIVEEIITTQNSAHVAAYFASYPDHLRQISSLSPRDRVREIDHIDRTISARLAEAAKRVPAPAPAPAQPGQPGQPAPQNPTLAATPTVNGQPATIGFDPLTATPAEVTQRLEMLKANQRAGRT